MNFRPQDFMQGVREAFSLVGAALKGKYPFPWLAVLLTLVCAAYVISPVDFLPDVMPLLGITDDGAFILLVLAIWQKNLKQYRAFLAKPDKDSTVIDAEAYKKDKNSK